MESETKKNLVLYVLLLDSVNKDIIIINKSSYFARLESCFAVSQLQAESSFLAAVFERMIYGTQREEGYV